MKSREIDFFLLKRSIGQELSMDRRWLVVAFWAIFLLYLAGIFGISTAQAAQESWNNGRKGAALSVSDELRYELGNCATEIQRLQERNDNLSERFEELQQELSKSKESANGNLQTRLAKLETTLQSLTEDVKAIKNHSNQTATALAQYRQSLTDLEKNSSSQRDNVVNLESAMHSLMDLYQPKGSSISKAIAAVNDTSIAASPVKRSYKVKSGDTLDKIARENKTTVQELKRCNQLKKDDLIIVDQELALP